MIYSREVIPTSLEHALIAAKIVAALEEMEHRKSGAPIPTDALDDAIQFFDKVSEGRNNVLGRDLGGSWEGALAYSEAIRAIGESSLFKEGPDEFDQVLLTLRNIAQNLKEAKSPPKDSIRILASFFRIMGDMSLASDKRSIERLSVPE